MSITPRSGPKKNGYSGNYCAYCYYWEGDSQLRSRSAVSVEFDIMAQGHCMFNGRRIKGAGSSACRNFVLSNEAGKYAR